MKTWLLGLTLASAAVCARGQTIGVHLTSWHAAGGEGSWNNQNYGLYLRTEDGLTLGGYRNSRNFWSNYAGWTLGDQWALTLGVVTGYDKVVAKGTGDYEAMRCEHGCRMVSLKQVLSPLVVPSVKLPLTDHFALRLSLMVGRPTALHLSAEAKF